MPRFAADDDFNRDIVRGVLRRDPAVDLVCAEALGLSGADNPAILEWAADHRRVLLTHAAGSMTRHALERIQKHRPMPGVFEASRKAPVDAVIDDILLLAECSLEGEWEGQVRYLPLE